MRSSAAGPQAAGARSPHRHDEELLEGMLSIPSPSGEEDRLGEWLTARLGELGFASTRDEVGNVVGTWGEGERELLLLGHMDTAPGWIDVGRDGGRLHGRGAVDAKGPLAAAICAVARQPRDASRRRLTVIAAVEEEASSKGAWHLVNRTAPEELVVLEPSGWDAVTVGYKGSMRVAYRVAQASAHGAGPVPSAADRAVAFIRRLQDHATTVNADRSVFDRLDVRVTRFEAGSDGLEDAATVDLGLRLPIGCDIAGLRTRLKMWCEDARLTWTGWEPAVRTNKSSRLSRRFVQAIRQSGGTPRFKVKTGTSDMNVLTPIWRCPSVAYGPGDSLLDHSPQEALDLDDYHRGIDVLSRVLSDPEG